MRNLAGAGVGGHFLHEVPILTAPLVGGGVLEVEVLLDVVGSELDTGLFIADSPLRSDIADILSVSQNLLYIPGKVCTCII